MTNDKNRWLFASIFLTKALLTIIFTSDMIVKISFTPVNSAMNNQTYHERGALAAISDARPKLKGSAQKAAQYILNSPRETINLTITELAVRAGVSQRAAATQDCAADGRDVLCMRR